MKNRINPSSRAAAARRREMKRRDLKGEKNGNPLCRLPKYVAVWTEELTLGGRKTLVVLGCFVFSFSAHTLLPHNPLSLDGPTWNLSLRTDVN